jgi:hypothetical protein
MPVSAKQPNPTADAAEASNKQQCKQQAISVKNVLSSLMMDVYCPEHVGFLMMVHSFNKCFKEIVFYVF